MTDSIIYLIGLDTMPFECLRVGGAQCFGKFFTACDAARQMSQDFVHEHPDYRSHHAAVSIYALEPGHDIRKIGRTALLNDAWVVALC